MGNDEEWLLREKYAGEKTEGFFTDCERLNSGEPLGYVIGHVPFLNCQIHLDSHPLIPRVETEFWVEKAINEIKSTRDNERLRQTSRKASPKSLSGELDSRLTKSFGSSSIVRVLDLCAGSGAIGVAVAKAVPEAHVTLAEIDQAHLPTIGKNLSVNDISCTRYQVFQSNLFENISGQFDFILSNPPYIDPKVDRIEPSVKEHEPDLALYGGENGMELVTRIIAEARAKLAPHGQLWLEHEPEQSVAVAKLADTYGLSCITHQDQYQIERYSILMLQ